MARHSDLGLVRIHRLHRRSAGARPRIVPSRSSRGRVRRVAEDGGVLRRHRDRLRSGGVVALLYVASGALPRPRDQERDRRLAARLDGRAALLHRLSRRIHAVARQRVRDRLDLRLFRRAARPAASRPVLGHSRRHRPARNNDRAGRRPDRQVRLGPLSLRRVPHLHRGEDAAARSGKRAEHRRQSGHPVSHPPFARDRYVLRLTLFREAAGPAERQALSRS
jgi:hypothetical protein